MIIILKKIPAKTQKQDIKNFITPIANGSWLSRRGQIKSISIIAQKNIHTRLIDYNSLVEILPDSVAKRVIKKLHRKNMIGSYIAVCEYKNRDWHNDPRVNKPIHNLIKNRRITDRRNKYENIMPDNMITTGKRIFYDKGW